MKKAFKIIVYTILAILLLLFVTPVIFKSKIIDTVNSEINKSINANVEFKDVKLSLLKSFPNFFFGIYDLSIVGTGDFKNDTLLAFKAVKLDINVASVIFGNQIKINSIIIDKPIINGIILENGLANWDIVQATDDTIVESDTNSATSTSSFSLGLKKFIVKNGNISYTDKESVMAATLHALDFELTGDFTEDFTKLLTQLSIDRLNFKMDGINYLKDARIIYTAGLDADLQKYKFTLNENELKVNDLEMSLDGFVELLEKDINLDLKFGLKESLFKDLLSLVPVVYKTDFENIETHGKFAFNGFAKGIFNDENLPSFNLSLLVKDAMFKYPDIPSAVNNINIDMDIANMGGSEDNTIIDVNKFQLNIADNPVNMTLHLKTPISNPNINANLMANLDFSAITKAIPIDDMQLSGLLDANLIIDGDLSTIEEEHYEDFNAKGNLNLKDFKLTMSDLPYSIEIKLADMVFSPKRTVLNNFDMKIGESDFHFKGQMNNYISYLLSDGILMGEYNYKSNYINVDEFMAEDSTEAVEEDITEQDTVPMSPFEIPKNINFILNSSIDKINYDKTEITKLSGKIELKDGIALMDNIKMDLLKGSLVLSGEYNTQVIEEPKVDLNMQISNFDIASTYKSLNTIQAIAPAAQNMIGIFSSTFSFKSLLNNDMEPINNTIISDGRLTTQNIELKGSKTLNKIGEALKTKQFSDLTIKDIDLKYHIKDGVVELEPFTVKAGNINTEISGKQGLDKSIHYKMLFDLPASFLGAETNAAIAGLTGFKATENSTISIGALVTGFFDDPKIKITKGEQANITDNVKENLNEKKEELVDKAKEEAKAKADKIIADADKKAKQVIVEAEKVADKLTNEAKATGDNIISEADKQGKELIRKAGSNPLKKKLAQESAKKINSEAKDKADKLNKEAENIANSIISEARNKADKIREDARKNADAL